MSAVTEYLKLIPRGIKNIDKIFDGVFNNLKLEYGHLNDEDLKIITIRRLICKECPYMSVNATNGGYYASSRKEEHCIHCGCPINIRTASLEANCGIEVYNEKNSNTPLKLKWEKIK